MGKIIIQVISQQILPDVLQYIMAVVFSQQNYYKPCQKIRINTFTADIFSGTTCTCSLNNSRLSYHIQIPQDFH